MLTRAKQRVAWLRDVARRTGVERLYLADPPPVKHGARQVLLVDGLWDNANHWLRLWLFMHAFLSTHEADVVGLLPAADNWDNWRKRRSLEALGVRRFLYLRNGTNDLKRYRQEAGRIIAGAATADDMLALRLPEDLPAYTVFDSVLKSERHPQPPIVGNDAWARELADALRLAEIYRNFFDTHDVISVVGSHAWKNEWSTLCWTALQRRVPYHYMTAHYDSVRVRRMRTTADYRAPNEHLPAAQFDVLPADVRKAIVDRGHAYMRERFAGTSDFIVLRYSVRPEQRGMDKSALLTGLGLDPAKPLAVIYAHSWFDFPHTQAMTNFREPLDWLQYTLPTIASQNQINWAIKPHPCDRWYGDISLAALVSGLPAHIAIIPEDTDSLAVQRQADALTTIQGSIAVEGAAMGKRVLCADRSMYSDWGFTHVASSRDDYGHKLRYILDLAEPTREQSDRAMAVSATALAPPPREAGSLTLTCDTRFTEENVYPGLRSLFATAPDILRAEIAKMRQWLDSPYDSYNAWRTVDHCLESTKQDHDESRHPDPQQARLVS